MIALGTMQPTALTAAQQPEEIRKLAEQSIDAAKQQLAKDKKLRDVAGQFEAMFISMLMKQMRKTVPENPYFSNSQGERIWTDFLDQEISNQAGAQSRYGIADAVYREFTRNRHSATPQFPLSPALQTAATLDLQG